MTNILFTGIPRSGTTLSCFLLNQAEDTVALHEPIDTESLNLDNPEVCVEQIVRWTSDTRSALLSSGRIVTKQKGGELPSNPVEQSSSGGLRKETVTRDTVSIEKTLSNSFTLVVKHNALFSALIHELQREISVFGLVRNPLAVLCSWQSVDLPVNQGRLPVGERLDAQLKKQLDAQTSCLDRQLTILEWFYQRLSALNNDHVFRYEDIVSTKGKVLERVFSHAIAGVDIDSEQNNANPDKQSLDNLTQALLDKADIYNRFYSMDDVERQKEAMLS